MLFSKGVIMDNKEMEGPFPCPDIESSTIVCAFLPQIPNVRIKSFKMSECRTIRETAIYQEIISTIVNQKMSTSNHEISTCLMLFCNYEGHTTAKRWASAIQKRYNLYLIQAIIHIQVYIIQICPTVVSQLLILDNIFLFLFAFI